MRRLARLRNEMMLGETGRRAARCMYDTSEKRYVLHGVATPDMCESSCSSVLGVHKVKL